MDFRQSMQTSGRPVAPVPAPAAPIHKDREAHTPDKGSRASSPKFLRVLSVFLLAGIVVLLVGVIFVLNSTGNDHESKFISQNAYQAVFLNNGQVYFGNIQDMNDTYVRMTNIYYLTQGSTSGSTTASSNNYSLVKLGCQQIHDPLDEMVINRSQVTFWENLNGNGKVVSSIKQFKQQNPNGPDCSQVSSQTQASSSAAAQGGSSSTTTNSSSSNSSTSGH